MSYLQDIRSYISESDERIIILKNRINILNYSSLGLISSNTIIVKMKLGDVVIKGNNLVISKLMNNEILIKGNLSTIEFR